MCTEQVAWHAFRHGVFTSFNDIQVLAIFPFLESFWNDSESTPNTERMKELSTKAHVADIKFIDGLLKLLSESQLPLLSRKFSERFQILDFPMTSAPPSVLCWTFEDHDQQSLFVL